MPNEPLDLEPIKERLVQRAFTAPLSGDRVGVSSLRLVLLVLAWRADSEATAELTKGELAAHSGLSTRHVKRCLSALEGLGYIAAVDGRKGGSKPGRVSGQANRWRIKVGF